MKSPNRYQVKIRYVLLALIMWLMVMVAPAAAELAPNVFLGVPLVDSINELQLESGGRASAENPQAPAASALMANLKEDAAQSQPVQEPNPVPEEDSVLINTFYTAGFYVTFLVVSTGYIIMYATAGTWGAVKCIFVDEDWNTCWHTYMNRVFH